MGAGIRGTKAVASREFQFYSPSPEVRKVSCTAHVQKNSLIFHRPTANATHLRDIKKSALGPINMTAKIPFLRRSGEQSATTLRSFYSMSHLFTSSPVRVAKSTRTFQQSLRSPPVRCSRRELGSLRRKPSSARPTRLDTIGPEGFAHSGASLCRRRANRSVRSSRVTPLLPTSRALCSATWVDATQFVSISHLRV